MAPTATSSLYARDYEQSGKLIPALIVWRDDDNLSYSQMIFRLHDVFKIDTSPGTLTKWFRLIDERILPQQAAQ